MTDLAKLPLWRSTEQSMWRDALDGYDQAIVALANRKLPEHDQWYRHELPGVVVARSPGYVTHDEMVRITEWKMLRGVWRAPNLVLVKNNPTGAVEAATSTAAGLLDTPPKALAAVVTLGGVGPATASAVLAGGSAHSEMAR